MNNLNQGHIKIQFTHHPAPLVSIIVPCYNYGHYLAETLENLIEQSWQFWECIIVDDGSTDNSKQVAESFIKSDTRFKYIFQQNQGLSAARNAGIDVCKGSYIQFLDADDMLEENKLKKQVSYLEKHSGTDIVYGHVHYFEQNPMTINLEASTEHLGAEWMPRASGAGSDILLPLIRGNIMVVNAPLLRKSVIDDVKGFKEHLLRGYEDWDFWVRCALAGKRIQYLNEEGTRALVRLHHKSMSKNMLSMYMSHIKVREELQYILPSGLCRENNYRIGVMYAKIAKFQLANGKWFQCFRHILTSIWRSHINIKIFFYLIMLFLPGKLAVRLKKFSRLWHISS